MSKRVAVLMGGRSAEREVSLVSGARLRRRRCARRATTSRRSMSATTSTTLLARPRARARRRSSTRCTAASARTATIQGLLELLGLPYTHSGVLASALAMDKPLAKQVFAAAGLRCPEGKVRRASTSSPKAIRCRGPIVVKPATEGSSVGVRIVRDGDNLPPLGSGELALRRRGAGRALYPRPRADRRGHGRRRAGGHRASPAGAASTTTKPNTPRARPSI